MIQMEHNKLSIAVIGLGYVGLPLAVEFGKKYPTLGYDLNLLRVSQLIKGHDHTGEVSSEELKSASYLTYTANIQDLKKCSFFVVAVPTPVDDHKVPDLGFLKTASQHLGSVLPRNSIVVYESTVYPGVTEEICVPILEQASGLIFNQDFFVGYSPERINPGDKEHRLTTIVKITSGSTPEVAEIVDCVYASIYTRRNL
nr:hypothetical protein [Thermosynechococcus sp. M3746_W2019_013]